MLEEIIKLYDKFSDSIISEINYKREITETSADEGTITIIISCFNYESDYKKTKLVFNDIITFKLNEIYLGSNLYPKEIFIMKKENVITFDFDPINHFDYLEENPNSSFIIKCKEISYELLSSD